MPSFESNDLTVEAFAGLGQEALAFAVDLWRGASVLRGAIGVDQTGTVRAIVDRGGVVEAIELDERWAEEMDSDQLTAAMVTAVHDGQRKRIASWAPASSERAEHAAGQAADVVSSLDVTKQRMGDRVTPDDLGRRRQEIRGAFSKELMGRASSGRAVVMAIGPSVKAIDLDRRWSERADSEEIARHVTEAFRDLYRNMPDDVVNALSPGRVAVEISHLAGRMKALRSQLDQT